MNEVLDGYIIGWFVGLAIGLFWGYQFGKKSLVKEGK